MSHGSYHRMRLYEKINRALIIRPTGYTDRQKTVLELFQQGQTEAEIAAAVGMSRARVNNILQSIVAQANKAALTNPLDWAEDERKAAMAAHRERLDLGEAAITRMWETGWALTYVGKPK